MKEEPLLLLSDLQKLINQVVLIDYTIIILGGVPMDIAGLSMAMASNNQQTKVGTAVLSKAMDTNEALGQGLVQMIDSAAMERSVTPELGANIDLRL